MKPELPRAIAFLLGEFPGTELELADVRDKLRDPLFARDFFDQCVACIERFRYADRLEARNDKFDVYAGPSLDPLEPDGKCRMFDCRIAFAQQFARTAC